jgi:iron complex transport system ATP-binding protein
LAVVEKKENGIIKKRMSERGSHKVLITKDLSIGYGSKKEIRVIAKHMDLNLNKGELVCLVGKNGIGKSTLLRTLSKMQPRLDGNIFLEDKSIDLFSRNELAKIISLVLTERIPSSNLTVYELIALGRQPYTNWIGKLLEEDLKQIKEAMSQSHLTELMHERCDKLSDGQLQRAMICRALAQNTDLIILDEPTAHLDVQHKMETFKLLKKIAHELNRAILISTHEIQLATQIADELWLMTEEKIITGTPSALIESDQINLLFDSDSMSFDKETKQFIMK